MILPNRNKVIENIKNAVSEGRFDAKVELDDPILTSVEKKRIIDKYLKTRNSLIYKMKNKKARKITAEKTKEQSDTTSIVGIENIEDITTGAIVTSNHFGPLDSVPIRKLAQQKGMKNINIVAREENLAMQGIFGLIMNYLDIIPISHITSYMKKDFLNILKEKIDNKEYILVYPESEMWYNYKKPRPCKRGAYFYAAKLNVPIISCFVELREDGVMENKEFYKVHYVLHVLPTIYPDPNKSINENATEMRDKDYNQKKDAYERIYEEALVYDFKPEDIAGWRQK